MDLRELVAALLKGDILAARQFVADAARGNLRWDRMELPAGLSSRERAVAAAIVELLASRAGMSAPAWSQSIGPVRGMLVLDPGLESMPRSFARARIAGPEPLRKRNIVAPPDFLDVA